MTGDAPASILTSDDPDLEDGEIASDEEGAETASPVPVPLLQVQIRGRDSPKLEPKEIRNEPRNRNSDVPRDRRGDDRRSGRRDRPNESTQDEPERKRKKVQNDEENADGEVNEEEMLGLCVRGGSPSDDLDLNLDAPVWKSKATGHMDTGWADDGEERKRRRGHSPPGRRGLNNDSKARLQMKRKMKPRRGVADKEVCLNYLKGMCTKGADCSYSHNVCPPRKMELCKFYLKDSCVKRDKCLYLHEEFPCKFFHTGLQCYADNCKFSHEPLNNITRELVAKLFPQHGENRMPMDQGGGNFSNDVMGDNMPANPDQGFQSRRDIDYRDQRDLPATDDPNNRNEDSPRNRRRDDQRNWNRRDVDERRSPLRQNRGDKRSPDNQGRFRRGREDQDERRRGRDDRRRGEDSPRKRNMGPDDRNRPQFGPNFGNNNFMGPGMPNNFNPNFNANCGPNGPNFGPNFGPGRFGNGPNDRFGPNCQDQNQRFDNRFGPMGPENNFNPNFGNRFGGNEQFNSNFNHFEGMMGPNNQNEGKFQNDNQMFNQQQNNPRMLPEQVVGPDNHNRGDRSRGKSEGGDDRWTDESRTGNRGPADVDRRSGNDSHRRGRLPDNDWRQQDENRENEPQVPVIDEDPEVSQDSQENQYDFAKELVEYKNKKMEIELARLHTELETVIEKPPVLHPVPQPAEEVKEQPVEDAATFPPAFTQMYPPFPATKEKAKEKEKSKKHHHKKKKRHSIETNENGPKKSRKEKREKKGQPVIINPDGNFGGIKFRIKLNNKEEGTESGSHRLSEFMSSDDELPLTALKKRRERGNSGCGGDGDETDTESRLIIETNDDPLDRPQDEDDVPHVPKHLPKIQQELFMRIQGQQTNAKVVPSPIPHDVHSLNKSCHETEESSRRSGSKTPTPEPADENWYSSDEESSKPATIAAPSIPLPQAVPSKIEDVPYAVPMSSLPERSTTPPGPPPIPNIELAALKDLSKINITELLTSIRQIAGKSQPVATSTTPVEARQSPHEDHKDKDSRARDPRMGGPTQQQPPRRSSAEKPPYAKSIYKGPSGVNDLDLRVRNDVDERLKDGPSKDFGDVDLRMPLPPIGLGLPFKPAPLHQAATEIEASLASHPPMEYKVVLIHVPDPDFSHIKISPSDPLVTKDPRLRRIFRVSSTEEPSPSQTKPEEVKKVTAPADPRRKNLPPPATSDTPKSPPESAMPRPTPEPGVPRLTPQLLALVQLGLSAATGGNLDPRMRNMLPGDLEALRSVVSGLRPEDLETIRNAEVLPGPMEGIRQPGQGLLPTPPAGMGLLPTPPAYMMNSMMQMDPMMVPPMGPMGPMGGPMNPQMGGPMNQPIGPFGFGGDQPNDADMRGYRGNFRGNDRRGRGNWRGGGGPRDWENRRQRNRPRDRDDRREKRSFSPEQEAQ